MVYPFFFDNLKNNSADLSAMKNWRFWRKRLTIFLKKLTGMT